MEKTSMSLEVIYCGVADLVAVLFSAWEVKDKFTQTK